MTSLCLFKGFTVNVNVFHIYSASSVWTIVNNPSHVTSNKRIAAILAGVVILADVTWCYINKITFHVDGINTIKAVNFLRFIGYKRAHIHFIRKGHYWRLKDDVEFRSRIQATVHRKTSQLKVCNSLRVIANVSVNWRQSRAASSRKRAYSNILKILQPKKKHFQIKILIFFIFFLKT